MTGDTFELQSYDLLLVVRASRGDLTRDQLQEKLTSRGWPKADAEAIVADLAEAGAFGGGGLHPFTIQGRPAANVQTSRGPR